MTVSFGQVGAGPLRVYLAGSADTSWRFDLLRPSAHEAYAAAVQGGEGDIVLHDALPYGHTMVGPFQVRTHLDRHDLVPNDVYEFTRARHLQNVERWRLRAISKADIVFCWVPIHLVGIDGIGASIDLGAELGIAYGSGKAIVLAASSPEVFDHVPLLTEFAWKMIVEKDAKTAYERIMADRDVTFERGMARIEAKFDGKCIFCQGSYREKATIYWAKNRGAMHADCYERYQNESKDLDALVFNSELVHALRTENADLEKECLASMTKASMLEQEKAHLLEEKAGLVEELEELRKASGT